MAKSGYKKYMKKESRKDYSIIKLFVFTFFGMLLIFTVLIKSFSPTVDTSIGDYDTKEIIEENTNIDNRLAFIQEEDNGKDFSEIIRKAEENMQKNIDLQNNNTEIQTNKISEVILDTSDVNISVPNYNMSKKDPTYKVYIGSYSSAEQAKVAKDIISETSLNLTPIVKCLGSNDYTLQVGIYKNKDGADNLLQTIRSNHLPGRIVEDY